jgi:hypothetical protein
MPLKITALKSISGGQTGADRAALDWAIRHGIPHGGWCPQGRKAEDGVLDAKYHLDEISSGSYRQRTKRNVIDSDGTLILNMGDLDGGTLATQKFALQFGKPCYVVQLDNEIGRKEAEAVMYWMIGEGIATLNVAGPRESKRPGVYAKAFEFLDCLMEEFLSDVAYTIMPDFGMAPWAWVKDASDETTDIGGNIADGYGWYGKHPIPQELLSDFIVWANEFDGAPLYVSEVAEKFDWSTFHIRGLALATRLKAELGEVARVYYVKPCEDPRHEDDEIVEIMAGGVLKKTIRLRLTPKHTN